MVSLTDSAPKKDIVVVGGGGAGTCMVKELVARVDKDRYTLTLVDSRPFTIFLPATVRMAVTDDGHLEDRILIPFDKLLKDVGKLKVGTVVRIEEEEPGKGGQLVLRDGETVHYDVLVMCPGTRLNDPIDYPESKDDILRYVEEWRAKFRDAKNIIMGGGGPVNIEIAGEIKEYFPEKTVTIIQSRALPLPSVYSDRFRQRVEVECRKMGIEFVFEDYLDGADPKNGFIATRKGKQLPADLVVTSYGGYPNTEFIKSLGDDALTARGFVPTNSTLELPGHPGIFCIGDVVDNDDRNGINIYIQHAKIVRQNVFARLTGKEPTATYGGSRVALRLSLGKNGGLSYYDIWGGIILGNWFTKWAQSRDLLVPMARWFMGFSYWS